MAEQHKICQGFNQSDYTLCFTYIQTNSLFLLLYIYFACLFECFFYPINVKTAELIGPKFCAGPYMTPGKVCR